MKYDRHFSSIPHEIIPRTSIGILTVNHQYPFWIYIVNIETFGQPANTRCVQLSENNLCMIFGSPLRQTVCDGLQPSVEMCGSTRAQAMIYLLELESLTAP